MVATWTHYVGATNAFDLHTDVLLQDGDVTVALQGSGLFFARNRATQALDLLCTTNRTFTMDVAQWRNTYCDTSRVPQAFLLCEAPGAGTITHGYSHPQNAEVACAKTMDYAAYSIRAMQITSETNSTARLYNPCGIAIGGSAKFKIDIDPVDAILDDRITWSVAQGNVSFASGNNHGKIVTVNGGGATEADFKLEINIENGNLQQKPFFTGKTLLPTLVPVTVWIVRDDDGNYPAITPSQLNILMIDVNKLYEQAAISFVLNGTINYTNTSAGLDFIMTNETSTIADDLVNLSTYSSDGIKLIFNNSIRNFDESNGATVSWGGFNEIRGIVVATGFDQFSSRIVAHEIGHICNLPDIYDISNDTPLQVDGETSSTRIPQDHTGGYYSRINQDEVIKSLLMYGYTDLLSAVDIPTGGVYGLFNNRTNNQWFLTIIPVGLSRPIVRQPIHY